MYRITIDSRILADCSNLVRLNFHIVTQCAEFFDQFSENLFLPKRTKNTEQLRSLAGRFKILRAKWPENLRSVAVSKKGNLDTESGSWIKRECKRSCMRLPHERDKEPRFAEAAARVGRSVPMR